MVRDVGLAEDLAQDALVAALERWPETGIPDNPGAWLMATAKNRAIDQLRRRQMLERKHERARATTLAADCAATTPDIEAALDEDVGDDLLRLVLIACHPVLSTEARVALTLRLLGGLTTDEIARAFLVPEPTIAQRIVRAKRTLAEARVPFEVPRGAELAARLPSVLEVIYLIFNEGYAATRGDDWMRPELCEDALRLGRILAGARARRGGGARPRRADGAAGVAHARARRARRASRSCCSTRTAPAGTSCSSVAGSRRSRAPRRSRGRSGRTRCRRRSPPATRARARPTRRTGTRIVALYDALVELTPSPVVELNRAVAVAMAFGPAAGLELVDALVDEPALAAYHLLPSVRGDLLAKLGRVDEARDGVRARGAHDAERPASGSCSWRAPRRARREGDADESWRLPEGSTLALMRA